MAGEDAIRSGRDGEKMTNELMKLIGWHSISCNFNIDCTMPSKHKNKEHGIDLMYSYDNPLNHDNTDIIIGSTKHNQGGYASVSNIYNHINELCISMRCARNSDEIPSCNNSYKKNVKGVLFWLSSNRDDDNIHKDILENIDFRNLEDFHESFDEIYVVDNKRATFLFSSIKNAESLAQGGSLKFLYQNTGKNMQQEQLLITGSFMPVEMLNSEIIPLVIEKNGIITCLLFCSNNFSPENLSRLIWLSHKLCGLTNAIKIYFSDYDNNNLHIVNKVKQRFKDEQLTSKISVHRSTTYDVISLKEDDCTTPIVLSSANVPSEIKSIEMSRVINDDIDKILPYGSMLIPKLKSTTLTDNSIKDFLFKKGVFTSLKNRDELLNIFTFLILSPRELDILKSLYFDKQNKVKEVERYVEVDFGEQSLWEYLNTELNEDKEINCIAPPKNCEYDNKYSIERIGNDNNHLKLSYKIVKTNTNKDFLTGKTTYDGEIELQLEGTTLTYIDRHTASETYKINQKHFKSFENKLIKNGISSTQFSSIKFLDFTNKGRIIFLLSFLDIINTVSDIKIEDIIIEGMVFRPDAEISELPRDLASLKKTVTNLNLRGKKLDDTIYLSDDLYRDSILCEKLSYKLKYKAINKVGYCDFEVAFAGALYKHDTYNNSELKITVSPSRSAIDTLHSNSISKIKKLINELKAEKHNQYKRS